MVGSNFSSYCVCEGYALFENDLNSVRECDFLSDQPLVCPLCNNMIFAKGPDCSLKSMVDTYPCPVTAAAFTT